jgi:hypothetical protein
MVTEIVLALSLILTSQESTIGDDLLWKVNHLPIKTGVRKSFLGGSYVLQVQNMSDNEITLWLEAKEKIDSYILQPRGFKDIGWAQGYRFEANDAFFLWADGCDTIRQMMPIDELSPWKIRFTENGGLSLNLSQSYVQNCLRTEVKMPIEQSYSNVVHVAIDNIPQVIFRDGSNRIFADIPVTTKWFRASAKVVIKTTVSFIPIYEPSSGKVLATDLQINNIDINLVPKEWLNSFKDVVNQLLVTLFKPVVIFQIDNSLLKYAQLLNVRKMVIRDGRLDIYFL